MIGFGEDWAFGHPLHERVNQFIDKLITIESWKLGLAEGGATEGVPLKG